jgi:hypothetical protein
MAQAINARQSMWTIDEVLKKNRQSRLSGGQGYTPREQESVMTSALQAEYNADISKRFNTKDLALRQQVANDNRDNLAAGRALDITKANATISYQNSLLERDEEDRRLKAIEGMSFDYFGDGFGGAGGKDTGGGKAIGDNVTSSTTDRSSPDVGGRAVGGNRDGKFGPEHGVLNSIYSGLGMAKEGAQLVNTFTSDPVSSKVSTFANYAQKGVQAYHWITSLFDEDSFYDMSKAEKATYYTGDDENATGSDFSSGTSGTSGDSRVVCTELHRQGIISDKLYQAERIYGCSLSTIIIKGYHHWAIPLVRRMRKSSLLTKLVYYISKPMLQEMAHRADKSFDSSLMGSVMLSFGIPLCYIVGSLTNRTETIVEVA